MDSGETDSHGRKIEEMRETAYPRIFRHPGGSAEGEAENSQAKGPDTGRYSGEHSTEEAKSFRSKDRAHEHLLFVRFHSL